MGASDLSPYLESPTVKAIYAAYKAKDKPRWSRRLGASVLGKPCEREVWYNFRWADREDFDGRMLRLFETGNREEPRIVDNLRAIGCEVQDRNPATGEQYEFSSLGGHLVAKLDAIIVKGLPEAPKTPHSAEMKTHGKSFTQITSKGVKLAQPDHYAQTILGMAMSGLTRSMYIAVEKLTDTIHAERFRIEDVGGDLTALYEKAERVVSSSKAPPRISDNPDAFSCKFCQFRSLCHGSKPPEPIVPAKITCRSCVHATAVIEEDGIGRWTCARHRKTLDLMAQERACSDHVFLPDFVPHTVVDGGDDPDAAWIRYQKPDGSQWTASKRPGDYQSSELIELPEPLVGGTEIGAFKSTLGAKVVADADGPFDAVDLSESVVS